MVSIDPSFEAFVMDDDEGGTGGCMKADTSLDAELRTLTGPFDFFACDPEDEEKAGLIPDRIRLVLTMRRQNQTNWVRFTDGVRTELLIALVDGVSDSGQSERAFSLPLTEGLEIPQSVFSNHSDRIG
jgi:hypothetical protein